MPFGFGGQVMVFRRRERKPTHGAVLVGQPGGVLVAGDATAVESVVAQLVEIGGAGARIASSSTVADLAAAGSTAGALIATHGQYVRLTARSMELIEEHGLVQSEGGSFWGFVRGSKRITGVLDFEKVNLGPEQMMALQTAAVGLALRAAIKEVQAAVERIEGKVDDVIDLLRSARLGNVLGTRRLLEPLVERDRSDGRISTTDWSAVAGLGADIARGIEALRAHIRSQLEEAEGGWRPGERVGAAEQLFERKGLLNESLALLVVAEHNLGAWHELRIAHIRVNEPEHLHWTLDDAQAAIKSQYEDDQSIVDALHVVTERLTTPSVLDGLAPWQRRQLSNARAQLDDLAGWFADQRLLDVVPLGEMPYPSVADSFRHIRRSTGELAGRSFDAVRGRVRRGGGDGIEEPEPPPPASPPP